MGSREQEDNICDIHTQLRQGQLAAPELVFNIKEDQEMLRQNEEGELYGYRRVDHLEGART